MVYYEPNYLCHYGLKGMKWGQRRWQNADGTFNAAGKARYFGANSDHRPDSVKEEKQKHKAVRKEYSKSEYKQAKKSVSGNREAKLKKAAKIGATVAAAGMLAYGGYKLYSNEKSKKAIADAMQREINAERRAKRDANAQKALAKMMNEIANDPNVLSAVLYDRQTGTTWRK